jgi:hypothetical protein
MAEAFGCYAEYVDESEGIRPALQRWKRSRVALLCLMRTGSWLM